MCPLRDAGVDRDSADNNLTVTFKTFVRERAERETANMFYISIHLLLCHCVILQCVIIIINRKYEIYLEH